MGRRWVVGAVGVVLLLALAGCKTDPSDDSTTVTRAGPRASLEFRPVEVILAPEGQGNVGPGPDQAVFPTANSSNKARYAVGAVALDERGVSDAVARFIQLQGWVVDLTLNQKGSRAFNDLAKELYPKQPPQNAVAIVVDGKVLSAPAFQVPSFEGGMVQISGQLSDKEAQTLAASLRP